MFLHWILEFTAGGVFLIAIPLWVEQLIKFGKSCFVHPNAGYGALFIIRILVQSPLERLVSIGIDPMIFHLFQGGSGFDLFLQGQELIISRFQF